MRASEALLLNSHMFPQAFSSLVTSQGSRCAIGTIAGDINHQIAQYDPGRVYLIVEQRYHIMTKVVDSSRDQTVMLTIIYLNDWGRWTRPQIAEWLRKVEDEYGEIGPQLPTKEGEHAVCNDHVTVDSERL